MAQHKLNQTIETVTEDGVPHVCVTISMSYECYLPVDVPALPIKRLLGGKNSGNN